MSKQDFIEQTLAVHGKSESLRMHLSGNFYPPLPEWVKDVFVGSFEKYWDGKSDIEMLQADLSDVYVGGLHKYGFDNYLNESDLS